MAQESDREQVEIWLARQTLLELDAIWRALPRVSVGSANDLAALRRMEEEIAKRLVAAWTSPVHSRTEERSPCS